MVYGEDFGGYATLTEEEEYAKMMEEKFGYNIHYNQNGSIGSGLDQFGNENQFGPGAANMPPMTGMPAVGSSYGPAGPGMSPTQPDSKIFGNMIPPSPFGPTFKGMASQGLQMGGQALGGLLKHLPKPIQHSPMETYRPGSMAMDYPGSFYNEPMTMYSPETGTPGTYKPGNYGDMPSPTGGYQNDPMQAYLQPQSPWQPDIESMPWEWDMPRQQLDMQQEPMDMPTQPMDMPTQPMATPKPWELPGFGG